MILYLYINIYSIDFNIPQNYSVFYAEFFNGLDFPQEIHISKNVDFNLSWLLRIWGNNN